MEQQLQDIWKQVEEPVMLYGGQVVLAILSLIIGWWIVNRISSLVNSSLHKNMPDETLAKFFSSGVEIVLKVLLVISVASMVGIETTSFVAVLGAASLAVGLALQGSLSNFAGGVMILIFRPIQVGEYISAQGHEGTVKDIGIFVTTLLTLDERIIIVPNGPLANGSITNYSRNETRAVEIAIGISYSDNIREAKEAMELVLRTDQRVLDNKNNLVGVSNLGDSSVDFLVRAFVRSEDYWSFYFDARPLLKQAVEEAGATIPFPQRDIHLLKESA
ncbi:MULTISPECIES: mechanosensitive ion channel family protein [unclassified Oleiphilus]|jgi:small conductance mechanosensitive channel|uniref:mechanosensitive ion channel family protein n=3 Tax=Oleiphilus TaxID=141450 RepID=UPI0007C280A2|nr:MULTISPECIES: mechanosensitive ion channel domain-containing protein [unclassified Oleiphilus]KZY50424.1 mechanosensitive ion channel protein [Oleiphilus sp. HI0050]KZY78190.1 mechanosensitive ion channel protein [Oleiphilus sp. HI0068]KZY78861.1 mechanosensitive ion channel protein [Oleiphilus sp. HI0069]KZY89550.1 mechanosensitive ion channel protein [Oleiphilus sp. HI0072]KZZ07084.1 mechanosensitive ion channel protein [Oleiphilus sp. HI0078]KZZ34219.1 mechanosensitive ion channel prote